MRGLAGRMVSAAAAFIDSLSSEQRADATAPFEAPDREVWTYLPGARPGLRIADMGDKQRALALDLLATSYSPRGLSDAHAVSRIEAVRRELAGAAAGGINPDIEQDYWVRVFGDPNGSGPWAWKVNGHHLAAHAVLLGDLVAGTPQFFGSEPAEVPTGPHAGFRGLPREEDLARELVLSLDEHQRAVAVASETAPRDISTRSDPVADPSRLGSGLAHDRMDRDQRGLLEALVRQYIDRAAVPVANRAWTDIIQAGLGAVAFTWSGGVVRGQGHYYAVHGPTFLAEYDNTQDSANHIHSVWRDLRHDWSRDLLVAHHRTGHPSANRREAADGHRAGR